MKRCLVILTRQRDGWLENSAAQKVNKVVAVMLLPKREETVKAFLTKKDKRNE
jgi:hypothetical protein